MTFCHLNIVWGCLLVVSGLSIVSADVFGYRGASDVKLFLPHDKYCDLFYRLDKCPNGLVFNPSTEQCDFPQNTDCGSKRILTGGPPVNPGNKGEKPFLIGGECASAGKCPPQGSTFLPHESACNLACGCKDGKSTLYSCERGLLFNPQIKLCDDPSRAPCNPGGPNTVVTTKPIIPPVDPTIPQGTRLNGSCVSTERCPANLPPNAVVFLPHLTVCNLFCGCNGNNLELYACPKDLHFNPRTRRCDLPSNAGCRPIPPHVTNPKLFENATRNGDCPTVQECPKFDPDFTIYLPHITDCGYFCRCDHGTARLHQCAHGLHFNPVKQTCDMPDNGICKTTAPVVTKPGPGNGGMEKVCPAEGTCSPGKSDLLPHASSCVLYCECVSGTPRFRECTGGLHFNPKSKKCEAPNKALCQGECGKLEKKETTIWSPSTCTSQLSKIGDVCKVKCAKEYEFTGSEEVTCTKQGWNGSSGLNKTPSCESAEEVGTRIINTVRNQTETKSNFLFVLDESTSLTKDEFASEISFIKAVVSEFPLSANRTAGVITFSGRAAVDIHMTYRDSCKLFQATDNIAYSGGSTDILLALRTAFQEISSYSSNTRTLVFLITDGRSYTNPTTAANIIKSKGHILFTIGVGQYDRKQLEPLATVENDGTRLFFGLTNFVAFNKIAEYLHTVHGYGANLNCVIPKIAV